jgi:hypothetical protein
LQPLRNLLSVYFHFYPPNAPLQLMAIADRFLLLKK